MLFLEGMSGRKRGHGMSKFYTPYPYEPYGLDTSPWKSEANAKYQPKRSQKIKNKRKGKKRK